MLTFFQKHSPVKSSEPLILGRCSGNVLLCDTLCRGLKAFHHITAVLFLSPPLCLHFCTQLYKSKEEFSVIP